MNLLLSAEEAVRGRRNGQIAARVGRQAGEVQVMVIARSGEESSDSAPSSSGPAALAALTTDAQLWAAVQLATSEGGALEVEPQAEGGLALRLTLRAAEQ